MAGLKYPLVELFTELDRLHFGGRLTAAGWRIKNWFFRPCDNALGECVEELRVIKIQPVRPGEDRLRLTVLHEMCHAMAFERHGPQGGLLDGHGHTPHWEAEMCRVRDAGETCLRGEVSRVRKWTAKNAAEQWERDERAKDAREDAMPLEDQFRSTFGFGPEEISYEPDRTQRRPAGTVGGVHP